VSVRIPDLTAEQLRALNSATQYPSILTYHAMGERGRLSEERTTELAGAVEVTEKIDGTNARIVVPPPGLGAPLIGSRTELLHYLDDVIANPAQGIVAATRGAAAAVAPDLAEDDRLVVLFGEVYGGRTTAGAKNYTTSGAVGFRVFDLARVPFAVVDEELAQVALWRDGGGQEFAPTAELHATADRLGLARVPVLPGADPVPASVDDTHEWLRALLTESRARLDDTGQGRPEGVVVRTADRSRIAKIRFEDYQRTAKAAARR
jgi:RNA ligase-like protein